MKKLFCIHFIILVFFSTNSFAENYIQIVENEEANIYLDNDLIKRKGQVIDFWQLLDYKIYKKNKKGIQYRSMEVHAVINCNDNTYKQTYIKVYPDQMGGGKIVDEGGEGWFKKSPVQIPVGSTGAVTKNVVCAR